jgi:hypothetical protein
MLDCTIILFYYTLHSDKWASTFRKTFILAMDTKYSYEMSEPAHQAARCCRLNCEDSMSAEHHAP